jgi:hypothetical protein
MRDRSAAVYLDRSPSWLQKMRADDARAGREGRKRAGPKWVCIGRHVFYRPADLDDWIKDNAVECGSLPAVPRGEREGGAK